MPNRHAEMMRHSDDVWKTVYRVLDDDDDARECYQQTFMFVVHVEDDSVVRNALQRANRVEPAISEELHRNTKLFVSTRPQGSKQAMCVARNCLLIGGYETVRRALDRLPK